MMLSHSCFGLRNLHWLTSFQKIHPTTVMTLSLRFCCCLICIRKIAVAHCITLLAFIWFHRFKGLSQKYESLTVESVTLSSKHSEVG